MEGLFLAVGITIFCAMIGVMILDYVNWSKADPGDLSNRKEGVKGLSARTKSIEINL